MTYSDAGVSVSSGNELVDRIRPLVASTARPGASAKIGGFGGEFDLSAAGYTEPPLLVSATDGYVDRFSPLSPRLPECGNADSDLT